MDKIRTYIDSGKLAHIADGTRNLYETVFSKIKGFCDQENIQELDQSFEDRMSEFVDYLKDSGIGGTTIKSYLGIVRSFFKAIGLDISYTYKLTSSEKKQKQHKDINRVFNEEEVELCLNHSFASNNMRNQIIVLLLHETGVRVNELANIRVKDIFMDEGHIKIKNSKTKIRYVFFSQKTKELLVYYIRTLNHGDLFQENDCMLFDILVSQIKKIIKQMLVDLDIDATGRGPHNFRHWAATWLFFEGNMRIEDVATLLGDTPEIILSTYIHPTPRMLKKRVAKAWGW